MLKPISVQIVLEVRGRPEKRPFIALSCEGIALDVGGIGEAEHLVAQLQQAMQRLLTLQRQKEQ